MPLKCITIESIRLNSLNFVQLILTILERINDDLLIEVLGFVHFHYSIDITMNPE
jgi:hypothetical protein